MSFVEIEIVPAQEQLWLGESRGERIVGE